MENKSNYKLPPNVIASTPLFSKETEYGIFRSGMLTEEFRDAIANAPEGAYLALKTVESPKGPESPTDYIHIRISKGPSKGAARKAKPSSADPF